MDRVDLSCFDFEFDSDFDVELVWFDLILHYIMIMIWFGLSWFDWVFNRFGVGGDLDVDVELV